MRSSASTFLANVALATASLAVMFGVAEATLAWRDWRWRSRFDDANGGRVLCTTAVNDSRLLYTTRPHACSSNSRGYLDGEHSVEKPAGVFRIAIIGDSVAAGQGVAVHERFASLLERNVSEQGGEVIVLARSGYSTSQELVIFESEALQYHPDLVIWVYCLNDPADPIYHDANGELGRYYYRPRSYALYYLEKLLFRAREQWNARACDAEYHARLHCVYRDAVATNIQAIGSIAREHGVPVLFAVVPVFDRDLGPVESVNRDLTMLAREAGLVPVDVWRFVRDAPPAAFAQRTPVGPDPWHPNQAGNARIAEALTDAVLAMPVAASRR